MIYINYDGHASPMLLIKFRGNQPTGSGEEDFLKVVFIVPVSGGQTLLLSRSRSSQGHDLYKICRTPFPDASHKVSKSYAFWF